MYTVKSTSMEGTYYLVNGWKKYKTFWIEPGKCKRDLLFKKSCDAKRSLTRLLKIMPEYRADSFMLVEIIAGMEFSLHAL